MSPLFAPRRPRLAAITALGALDAVLIAAFALAAFDADAVRLLTQPAPSAATAAPIAAPATPRFEIRPAPAAADLAETLVRPLFRADRRPPEPAPPPPAREIASPQPAVVAPPTAPSPDIRLVGIMTLGGQRKALVRVGQEPSGRVLGEGALVDVWRIARLDARTVTLADGERRLTLSLSDRPAPAEAPSAANAGPQR